MLGVVKLVPVPKEAPPVEAAYQLIVPLETDAPKVTLPVPHLEAGVVPVMVGKVLIIMLVPLLDPVKTGLLLTTRTR